MAKGFSNKTKSHQQRFLHEVRRLDTSAHKQMGPPRFTLDIIQQQQQEAKFLEINWLTIAANSWDWFKQRGRGFMSIDILHEDTDGNGVSVEAHYSNRADLQKVSALSGQTQQYLKAIDSYDPFTQILVLLNLPNSRVVNMNCFTPPLIPSECWQQFESKKAESK